MKLYNLIIFDVDGTLLDTSEGIISSVKYTINKGGLTELDNSVIKTFIGPPIKESLERIYGLDEVDSTKLTKIFRERYKDYDLLKARPYDGILDLFNYISKLRIKIGIATYKRQDYAENIVKHFGFSQYTDMIFGSDDNNKMRKRDIIDKCIKTAEFTDCNTVLMIGDSESDAVGAKLLGVDFLGVTYGFGFRTKEEIYKSGAVYAADNANDIANFIERGLKKDEN